jgi:hypothetical protein
MYEIKIQYLKKRIFRDESLSTEGYKKGGLVRQGKPKLTKKGWR